MDWPFSRRTTYVPNSAPKIKSADLNAMQDEIANINAKLLQSDFIYCDDFLTSSFTTAWTASGSPGCGVDDSSAGGCGAASFIQVAGADDRYIYGRIRLGNPASGLICSARFRVASWNGGTAEVGMAPGNGSHWIGFRATTASPTWKVNCDWNSGSGTDTGVAVSTSYQELTFSIPGDGNVYWYIDGALVHSEADTRGAGTMNLYCRGTCSAAMAMYCDHMKLFIGR